MFMKDEKVKDLLYKQPGHEEARLGAQSQQLLPSKLKVSSLTASLPLPYHATQP